MDRQNGADVARLIEELALNAESAGARRIDITLTAETLTVEDDGSGMTSGEFALAKKGLFTTKGANKGKGIKLVCDSCKSAEMSRTDGKTVIKCVFSRIPFGDIAGAVSFAAAGDADVFLTEIGEGKRTVFCGAAKGVPGVILENKKRVFEGKIIW